MNKQIEEMTKIMNETCNVYDEQGNHIRNKCGECECWSDDNHCCCSYNRKEAEALYNAGYRKANEIISAFKEMTKAYLLKYDLYLAIFKNALNHAEAELKKKYESGGADDV